MLLVDSLAEERIRVAIRRGEFDNLPGAGQPLILEDDSGIPEELRVAYRLLRNAGCLPPELTLRNEIRQLDGLLKRVELEAEQHSIRRRLCFLNSRLALQGPEGNLLLRERDYRQKMIDKLTRDGKRDIRSRKVDSTDFNTANQGNF